MQTSLSKQYCDGRLPWYTIYPTVSDFSETVGPSTHEKWLSGLPDESVSLYIHIPFCRSICWYCGFTTALTRRYAPILSYLGLLHKEIDLVAEKLPQPLPVSDVHFGGGTPTLIEPAQFLALMTHLRRCFAFKKAATLAIEIDPRTFTIAMAEVLAATGVNRASIGVQSFDPVVQKSINRVQCEAQTTKAVETLRQHGISRINFDLIFGLPNQTVQSCVQSATTALALRPNRFAVFGYSHVPSYMKRQRMIDETALPDDTARAEQSSAMADTLLAAGYVQIGLDHFSLPDDELAVAQKAGRLRRNSLGYSADTCRTVIGLGTSAISRLGEGYVLSELATSLYGEHINAGRLPTSKGHCLSDEDRLRAAIIENLMCYLEVDVSTICTAHGFDPIPFLDSAERLSMLAANGIVDIHQGKVRVKQEHRFVMRAVAAAFDAYLERSPC